MPYLPCSSTDYVMGQKGEGMKPLKCGNCSTCCQWGDDKSLRPVLDNNELKLASVYHEGQFVLASNSKGDCIYLIKGKCSVYEDRPEQCRTFDCRILYNQMKDKTFIKVILAGKRKLKK